MAIKQVGQITPEIQNLLDQIYGGGFQAPTTNAGYLAGQGDSGSGYAATMDYMQGSDGAKWSLRAVNGGDLTPGTQEFIGTRAVDGLGNGLDHVEQRFRIGADGVPVPVGDPVPYRDENSFLSNYGWMLPIAGAGAAYLSGFGAPGSAGAGTSGAAAGGSVMENFLQQSFVPGVTPGTSLVPGAIESGLVGTSVAAPGAFSGAFNPALSVGSIPLGTSATDVGTQANPPGTTPPAATPPGAKAATPGLVQSLIDAGLPSWLANALVIGGPAALGLLADHGDQTVTNKSTVSPEQQAARDAIATKATGRLDDGMARDRARSDQLSSWSNLAAGVPGQYQTPQSVFGQQGMMGNYRPVRGLWG